MNCGLKSRITISPTKCRLLKRQNAELFFETYHRKCLTFQKNNFEKFPARFKCVIRRDKFQTFELINFYYIIFRPPNSESTDSTPDLNKSSTPQSRIPVLRKTPTPKKPKPTDDEDDDVTDFILREKVYELLFVALS